MEIKITKIEVQKKRKTRYSLYSGTRFLLGVSQDTMLKYDLYTGKSITDQDLQRIRQHEADQKIRDQAFRLLSRRAHSSRELHEKLRNKGHAPDIIEKLIRDLHSRGYLNDQEFTRAFIEDEINLKHSGPLQIKAKLIQKGIPPGIFEPLLSELYNTESQMQNCRYLAEKKYKNNNPERDKKTRQKLISYLRSKGFNWENISAVVPLATEENDFE